MKKFKTWWQGLDSWAQVNLIAVGSMVAAMVLAAILITITIWITKN